MTYLPRYFQVFCLKWKVFHQHNEIPYYASLFQYSCINPFYISEELIENVPFGLFHMKIESVNCYKTFHKTSFCIFAPPYCSTGASRVLFYISFSCPSRLARQGVRSRSTKDCLVIRLGKVTSMKPLVSHLLKYPKGNTISYKHYLYQYY